MRKIKLNKYLRKIINIKNQKLLKNKDFSIIASNCNGGFLSRDLNLPYNSPFVDLWMESKDFIKCVDNLKHYMESKLTFVETDGVSYPLALLDDLTIHFVHYKSKEEAEEKWYRRVQRINYDNIFIIMTDRDGCTYQDISHFDNLPYKNKIIFTHKPYNEFKSAFYIKGFENEESVGMCFDFINDFHWKKHYDNFPYVGWFNGKLNF